MVRQTLVELNPVGFYFYPLTINMNRCDGSNTVNDPFVRICIRNKIEDVNLKVI